MEQTGWSYQEANWGKIANCFVTLVCLGFYQHSFLVTCITLFSYMHYTLPVYRSVYALPTRLLRITSRVFHACPSISMYIGVCKELLNLVMSFFSEVLHSDGNLEAEKSHKNRFSRKIIVFLKVGEKFPKWTQNRVFIKFCHYFLQYVT